jgi:hypothetical protein
MSGAEGEIEWLNVIGSVQGGCSVFTASVSKSIGSYGFASSLRSAISSV